ncbi:MAG: hypothetical protein AAF399_05360 [Bacteroidota bacterium]
MEEVFLWLQRTMLGMADEEEEDFIQLGRKLLTVHKYVVVNATTEAELCGAFWQEATALAKHGLTSAFENEGEKKGADVKEEEKRARNAEALGVDSESERPSRGGGGTEKAEARAETAKEKAREEVQEMLEEVGLGGGDDPSEDSVLLALPGFRFEVRRLDVKRIPRFLK